MSCAVASDIALWGGCEMKVKVSELKGRQLNYAVAVCEWGQPRETDTMFVFDTGNERG